MSSAGHIAHIRKLCPPSIVKEKCFPFNIIIILLMDILYTSLSEVCSLSLLKIGAFRERHMSLTLWFNGPGFGSSFCLWRTAHRAHRC